MKRFIAIILTFMSLIMILSGCQQTDKPESTNLDSRINVVCTIFPQYDWVCQILGDKTDNVELTLLLNNGVDLHNYQPSVEDIVKISTCDLFIYVGGESDEWVDDVLKDAVNSDMIVINLLDTPGVSVKAEEIIEGMEEEDHGHEDEDQEESHEEENEFDEHVWLSLKNAQVFCSIIAEALLSLDIDNSDEYKDNLASYNEKLKALDTQYQTAVNDANSVKTLLFGDRFPFRYLVDDYGISYYAAFPGCSAETEASFDTIAFLAEKVDELGLHTIMVTESTDQSIAKTIRSNTTDKNQQILILDSMQSVTTEGVQNKTTYLAIMESNLNVLKEAI